MIVANLVVAATNLVTLGRRAFGLPCSNASRKRSDRRWAKVPNIVSWVIKDKRLYVWVTVREFHRNGTDQTALLCVQAWPSKHFALKSVLISLSPLSISLKTIQARESG